jgi:hypothetical protein
MATEKQIIANQQNANTVLDLEPNPLKPLAAKCHSPWNYGRNGH